MKVIVTREPNMTHIIVTPVNMYTVNILYMITINEILVIIILKFFSHVLTENVS